MRTETDGIDCRRRYPAVVGAAAKCPHIQRAMAWWSDFCPRADRKSSFTCVWPSRGLLVSRAAIDDSSYDAWGRVPMSLIRGIAFSLTGLLLAGCMQTGGTLAPASEANFTPRDKQQLANPPYQRASISMTYQRQIVQFHR